MPTILNAANEVAVHSFLERKIGFLDICRLVEDTLDSTAPSEPSCLEDIEEIDAAARRKTHEIAARLH